MILTRTMVEKDYENLKEEGAEIIKLQGLIQMWYPAQHTHRLWEYALALRALKEVHGNKPRLLCSDHGCGAGFMSPLLYWKGHKVLMYEPWSMGNEETYMLQQMQNVSVHLPADAMNYYQLRNTPLCHMTEEDGGVDAAFCISTIEHIGEYERAFKDLLSTVKPGGLVFLTSDFAEDEEDHYMYSHLRAGKMFTAKTYADLISIAKDYQFSLLGGMHELTWGAENRLVNDYGFASLALVKGE